MSKEKTLNNIDQKGNRNIKFIVVAIFVILVTTITASVIIRGVNSGRGIAQVSSSEYDGNNKEFTGKAGCGDNSVRRRGGRSLPPVLRQSCPQSLGNARPGQGARGRGGDQGRLPPASAQVPPRRQQGSRRR